MGTMACLYAGVADITAAIISFAACLSKQGCAPPSNGSLYPFEEDINTITIDRVPHNLPHIGCNMTPLAGNTYPVANSVTRAAALEPTVVHIASAIRQPIQAIGESTSVWLGMWTVALLIIFLICATITLLVGALERTVNETQGEHTEKRLPSFELRAVRVWLGGRLELISCGLSSTAHSFFHIDTRNFKLQLEIEALRAQLENSEKKHQEETAKLNSGFILEKEQLNETISARQKSLDAALKAAGENTQKLNDLENEKEQLQKQLEPIEQQLAICKTSLGDELSKNADLEGFKANCKCTELARKVKTAETKADKAESKLKEKSEVFEERLESAEQDSEAVKTQLKIVREENEQSEAGMATRLTDIQNKRDEIADQLLKAKEQISKLQSADKALNNIRESLKKMLDAKDVNISGLEYANKTLKSENEGLMSKYETLTGELECERVKVSGLVSDVQMHRASCVSLTSELEQEKAAASKIDSQMQELRNSRETLANKLESEQAEVSKLKYQIQELETTRDTLDNELAAEKAKNKTMELQLDLLNEELTPETAKNETLEQQLQADIHPGTHYWDYIHYLEEELQKKNALFESIYEQTENEFEKLHSQIANLELENRDLKWRLSRACWCKRVDGAANGYDNNDENEGNGQWPGNNGDGNGDPGAGSSNPDLPTGDQQDGTTWQGQDIPASVLAGNSELRSPYTSTISSDAHEDSNAAMSSSDATDQLGHSERAEQDLPASVLAGDLGSGQQTVTSDDPTEGNGIDTNQSRHDRMGDESDGKQAGQSHPASVLAGGSAAASPPSFFDPCPFGENHTGCRVKCLYTPEYENMNASQQRSYRRTFQKRRDWFGCAYAAFRDKYPNVPLPTEASSAQPGWIGERPGSDGDQKIAVNLPGS